MKVVRRVENDQFNMKINYHDVMLSAFNEKRYDDIFKVVNLPENETHNIESIFELACKNRNLDLAKKLRGVLESRLAVERNMFGCDVITRKFVTRELDDKTFLYAISSGSKFLYDEIVSGLSEEYRNEDTLREKIIKMELIAYAAQYENFEMMKKFMNIVPPTISDLRKRNWKILHSLSENNGLNVLKQFVLIFGVDRNSPHNEHNPKMLNIDYDIEFVEVDGEKISFNSAIETKIVEADDCFMINENRKLVRGKKKFSYYTNPVAAELMYKKKTEIIKKFTDEMSEKKPESEFLTRNDICGNGHYYFHRLIARFDLEHLDYILNTFGLEKSDLVLFRDRDEIFPVEEKEGKKMYPEISFKMLFENCDLMKMVDRHIRDYGEHYEEVKNRFMTLSDGDVEKFNYR